MLSRRYFLVAVWCAAWAFLEGGLVWAEVRNPHGVAVIIGNRDYQAHRDVPHRDVPDVEYAERDAEAFERYVVEVLGFDPKKVVVLKNAKRREMQNALGNAKGGMSDIRAHLDFAGRSDVVVYYSGHGVPGLEDRKGYLLPVDVPPREAPTDGYPIELLYERLGELRKAREGGRARTVQVYLDACFSGGSGGGSVIRGASPAFLPAELPEGVAEGMTVLSAAGSKQTANWDEEAGHGLFTNHLLDALYGKGDRDGDGKVTAAEAKGYLDDKMTGAAWLAWRTEQRASLLTRSPEAVLLEAPAGGFPERPELGVGKVRGDDKVTGDAIKGEGEGEGRTGKGSDPPQGYKQAMFLLGMKEAFEARDYSRVLEYGKELEAVGGALPDEAHHFLGVARFHEGRPGEARVALRSYVEKAGKEGRYYEGSLKLLLAVKEKDDGAFAAAQSKNTVAGYGEYLSSWPGGRHRDEAERLQASAKKRERDREVREAAVRKEAERRKREQEDDAAFGEARGADTGSAYESYLSSYPRGRHAGEARSRRRELAEVERVEVSLELRREDRVMVQRGLESLGKAVGGADGVFGRRTRAGLRSWQGEKGLEETGYLTREQADALMAMGRELEEEAKERAEAERKAREQQAREEAARRERQEREAARRREAERKERAEAMYLLGMEEAFEARDYSRVLEYGKELEAVGGALPDEAHHFLGVARFHEGRPGEARVALRSYVEKAGKEGRYYEGSLKLLLAVKEKDDGAFAAAQSKNTVAGYGEYLSSWPGGRHRDEAERLQASAKKRERQEREAARRRELERQVGRVFRDCEGCPEMVVVPAGSFMMGSNDGNDDETPVHRVRIGERFAVAVYEVTFGEWEACVRGGGCGGYRPGDAGWGRGNRPVINVSWEDAEGYVGWLSRETGKEYRLLSEAEWEYVARAGSRGAYHLGDEIGRNRANCCGSLWEVKRTAPVGSFGRNGFGLYDVHGNVWEWVEDCWNGSYRGAPSDGRAWETGDCGRRVLRGGSWGDGPWNVRSANRGWTYAGVQFHDSGFRVARTLTP